MATFIVRRILGMIPTLLLISFLVFIVIEIMPGSIVDVLLGESYQGATDITELTEGEIKLLELRYGINKPTKLSKLQ